MTAQLRQEEAMSDMQQEMDRWIRERAYFLWLEDGCPEGHAAAHWRQACQEWRSAVTREDAERRLDAEEEDSFPASDPPSHTGISGERAA